MIFLFNSSIWFQLALLLALTEKGIDKKYSFFSGYISIGFFFKSNLPIDPKSAYFAENLQRTRLKWHGLLRPLPFIPDNYHLPIP